MPQSRELRGVVVPEVDDRAVRRQVERPLNRVMASIATITPNLDIGSMRSSLPGLSGSGSTGSSVGSNSIAVAQLDVLEDIRDVIRRQDGGGGGGLLTGLSLGRLAGGGGTGLLGGLLGAGGLAVGGSIGLGAIIQDQFGTLSLRELFNIQTSPGGMAANALTGGLAGGALGLGNILFEQVPNIGERLGLIESADQFRSDLVATAERTRDILVANLKRGARVFTQDIPNAINNLQFPEFSLPDFSSIQLPPSLRRLTDLLGGGGRNTESRTLDLRDRAADQSLSFSARRAAQGALGNQVRRGESTTVTVESPTLDVGEIRIDGQDILNDLQREVNQKLRELESQVSQVERLLEGRTV